MKLKKTQQVWRSAILLFAIGVLAFSASIANAQSPGGVGMRVANPDPSNPRSRSIFIYTLKPGEKKQDQLLIMNPTEEEQVITIGAVDGVVTNTGDYTCREEAEPVEDSGGWVQLAKREVTLPPKGEEKVDFTVTVPEQADVGEHNSCLTMQLVQDKNEEETSGGVRLRMRQGIRMVTTIPGDLKRDISIERFSINQGATEQVYTFMAANKGNVSADIDMKVDIVDMFGQEAASIGDAYPIVPNESLTKEFKTNLQPMFGGWYKVTPSLRYDKRLGAFGTQNNQAEYETLTGVTQTMFFWPTTAGWAIIATIFAIVLIIIWRTTGRVKRRRQLKASAYPYKIQKDDTIQTLAKKSKVSWQELAKLNKIAAPYSLEVGQEIRLPTLQPDRKKRQAVTTKG